MSLDPLQAGEEMTPTYESSLHSDSEDEHAQQDMCASQMEKRKAVLQWSTEQVKSWVQESVPFSEIRMQECLHAFQAEAIDGLSLLTLQKSHRACLGMNSYEWLLLKAARRRLLSHAEIADHFPSEQAEWRANISAFVTPPRTPTRDDLKLASPCSSFSLRSNSSHESTSSSEFTSSRTGAQMLTPQNFSGVSRRTCESDIAKDEQIEALIAEVQCLRGEVVKAEERQTTLQAQMHHMDSVLRSALLTGYLYTRTQWLPVVGEPLIDDADIDDWLQRFMVFQRSSICFYLSATDSSPQGTILLDDIIGAGPLPANVQPQNGGQPLFSFHITTFHGLRLECATPSKLQAESWLTLLGVDPDMVGSSQATSIVD